MGTRSMAASSAAPPIAVGPAHDPLEREAEQRAAQIVWGPPPIRRTITPDIGPPALRRACTQCEDEERTLQREAAGTAPEVAPAAVASVLATLRVFVA